MGYQNTPYYQYNQNYPSPYNTAYSNIYQSSQNKYDPNSLTGVSIYMKVDSI
jgi:hypothetical protein